MLETIKNLPSGAEAPAPAAAVMLGSPDIQAHQGGSESAPVTAAQADVLSLPLAGNSRRLREFGHRIAYYAGRENQPHGRRTL